MMYSKQLVAALAGCFTLPVGPAGPQGATGDTGTAGSTGATGKAGEKGTTSGETIVIVPAR